MHLNCLKTEYTYKEYLDIQIQKKKKTQFFQFKYNVLFTKRKVWNIKEIIIIKLYAIIICNIVRYCTILYSSICN